MHIEIHFVARKGLKMAKISGMQTQLAAGFGQIFFNFGLVAKFYYNSLTCTHSVHPKEDEKVCL